MSPAPVVPDVLGRARSLVVPALRRAVGALSEEIRPLAEYHFGWIDEFGHPVEGDGGKGIRPALALLSAEVVGAEPERAVPGAAAVELVHNFSLVHDDVIDEDAERRHRPTVWAVFGIGRAVVAGDALLTLAQQIVLDPLLALGGDLQLDPANLNRAARHLANATAAMNSGQALDMDFENRQTVTYEECLEMEAGKTGALLACASSIGAVLAGADEKSVGALWRFGMELGLSFQAVDDLLGVWGDPAATGKPAFSDLRQHKKTLPVTAAIAAGGAGAAELVELLSIEHLEDAQVARAAELVEELGGRRRATEQARISMEHALAALDSVGVGSSAHAELAELASFIVERQF